MNASVIEVEQLCTRFGAVWVHRDLALQVERGEVLALVGGSGSGKTTLLRELIGLLRPTSGRIRLFGEPLFSGDARCDRRLRRRFGVLFQQGALFSAFDVFDNLAFPLRELRLLPEDLIAELVMQKLAMVELLASHAHLMPAELSGGMVKRVALARALALEPELLLLDEPTAGLDPDRSEAFVQLIRMLRAQLGLTVVLVTHDLDTLAALSDRVAVLAGQRILALGPLGEVMQVDHPFIRNFFCGERSRRAMNREAAI
ncbi:MAG TPA: ABC transporter ATP-binding protein [Rhodocyclaceae bacterium]|nr:MAG: ABC transporter ATP-binding protein [Betaproteobacteria bacterium CG2_30_68_42]PIV72590.1 MAG: ABC transporter ATP-binding protein [Rhodocyclales bacterium CG17_big_fil_post_rev_8_21_14_2_50_68_7]PIX74224.1 MAG: ABC transporter ATP-binding protein [Rhodocyclales bacterium CG_4_10_14_3_um_filter_68_10]PJA57221.1 MAG: ABC transporter ATP-binding protein [Rhodocyclales bacterium CG_4_9_14_3_um_filter_68_10]HCX34952.1 ABC transporter ATP-binding protein [Rhodocyclaceae bacterium]